MIFKKKKICSLLLMLLLVGCGNNNGSVNNNSTSSNSSNPVSSTSTVSTNNSTVSSSSTGDKISSSTQDNFPELSEISNDISLSDALIDISLDLAVCTNFSMQIGFSFSEETTEGATVTTSHPDVLKYEYVGGRHIIKGLKAGKSYIIIKDYTGFIHYRKLVTVMDPIPETEIYDHLFNVDTWHSWFDASTLVFLENRTGIFKESDGFSVLGSFEFTYELEKIDTRTNEFVFKFTEVREKTVEYTPVGFNVSLCGDIIHLQDTNMTTAILQAHKIPHGSWQ